MKTSIDSSLPGAELVEQGLADLKRGQMTESALLVLIASPRLRSLGIEIPETDLSQSYNLRLYDLIEARLGSAAHSYYNSMIRRIVSFVHALEREA